LQPWQHTGWEEPAITALGGFGGNGSAQCQHADAFIRRLPVHAAALQTGPS
jgi:hypothetical protein